jgi:tetratricopeptide (TPR) repeat protein
MAASLFAIPLLLATQWVYFPIGRGLNGLAYPLWSPVVLPAEATLFSFGVVVIGLMLLCAAACWTGRAALSCVAGAGLLLIAWWAYLRVVNGSSGLLAQLAHEAVWLRKAYSFDTTFLPRNAATEASLWKQFSFETVWDRFFTGWYFMGIGWIFSLVAGTAMFVTSVRLLGARAARRATILTIIALILTGFILMRGPLAAQRAIASATRADAQGNFGKAIADYRRAARLDGWWAANLVLQEQIGAIETGLGRTATPAAQVYRAEYLVGQNQAPGTIGQLPAAIQIYRQLIKDDAGLRALATARAAEIETDYGANLLSDGAFGSANAVWESALKLDPQMWLARYYLSRGYYFAGRYHEAAKTSREVLRITADPRLLGDLYSNLGDALSRMGHLDEGHLAYAAAYKYDYMTNFRGIASLTGPQQ